MFESALTSTRPDSRTLAIDDCRRVLGVLDDLLGAGSLVEFRTRLVHALGKWFGWTCVTVHDGVAWEQLVAHRPAHTFSSAFLTDYVREWQAADPMLSTEALARVDREGVVLLSDRLRASNEVEWAFARYLLRPHGLGDVAGFAARTVTGVLYVQVFFRRGVPIGTRERAVMRGLGRHLGPLIDGLPDDQGEAGDWRLSARESQVAPLVAGGMTNDQIARNLNITVGTVKKHVTRILAKTCCASRTDFARVWWTRIPPSAHIGPESR